MTKKILVLTGSARKHGNSDMLADAFIKGAKEAGHTIFKFETARKDIKGCLACNRCYSNGDACSRKDDFNELAPLLEQADMIVIATPLYWFTFPAQVKAAVDKLYALLVGKRESAIRDSILLVCGETGEMTDFDGIIKTYELIVQYEKWHNAGILTVPGVAEKGDVLKTGALEKAEQMGLHA